MDIEDEDRPTIDPAAARRATLGMLALLIAGIAAYSLLRPAPGPIPAGLEHDPQLVRGRVIFLERCVACHGVEGRGDGPTAKFVTGPPPGNLTDAEWKHGDRPEQVGRVIDQGVVGTSMPAWGSILGPDGVGDVSAFVYFLAKRPVPAELRAR